MHRMKIGLVAAIVLLALTAGLYSVVTAELKDTVVKEEVSVSKRKVQDTEHVSGQVRHEELKIEKEGNPKMKGDRAPK